AWRPCARRRRTVRRSRPSGRTAGCPGAPPWRRRTGASTECGRPGGRRSRRRCWARRCGVRGARRGMAKYASHRRRPMTGDHSRPYGVVLRSRHGPSRPSQPRPPTAAGSAEAGRLPTRHARAYNLEIASLKGDTMSVARPGRKLLASAVLTALASFSVASLHAQEAGTPAAPEEEEATTLATITVTAQKREEALQDVPISVTALDYQVLQDTGVRDIKDLQLVVPGLTVTSTQNEAITTARIRGIGTVGDYA